jgi:hypothetical protein
METKYKKILEAEDAGNRIIRDFTSAVAIETANRELCSFILASAHLAVMDRSFAAQITKLMISSD